VIAGRVLANSGSPRFFRRDHLPFRYGSNAEALTVEMAMEYLISLTQMRMLHVPYKSTGLGIPDLISGQVQVMMTGAGVAAYAVGAAAQRARALGENHTRGEHTR
jgi:tripartite-type tricarboxylate transporter receptor subunit TctC